MNVYRKFLCCLPPSLVVIAAAYYAIFVYQFGAPIQTTYGVSDWATYKRQIADDTPGKRLMIFGDSSSLLGMNTPLLAEKTGLNVLNMALHGGFPLDWVTRYALENSRAGDTVVLTLAWTYFYRDYKNPEQWMLDQIVAWDQEYFYGLDPFTKVRFMAGVDVNSLIVNVRAKRKKEKILREFPLRRALSKEEVRQQHAQAMLTAGQPFSYSFLNMNTHGDLQGACGNAGGPFKSFEPMKSGLQSSAFQELQETALRMKQKGVRFYMAPSISLADQASQAESYRQLLRGIMSELRQRGIDVLGSPDDFYFPANNFYDTNFHLNCEAASQRTLKLYQAIQGVI